LPINVLIHYYLILLLLIGTLTINAQVKTPKPSPPSKIVQTVGLTEITVEYSRPSVAGRVIFGDLVPYGKTWRTGANENTKVTFADDVTIDSKTLKKGTYALYTVPNKESWDIIFYSDATNWGNPKKWDASKVALKTSVKPIDIGSKIESLMIVFDDLTANSGTLGLLWESTYVGIKIEVPTDKIASKSIDKVLAGPSANDFFNAARYYRQSGKDLHQALKWVTKAVDLRKEAFWMLHEKSLIQAALGNKKGAVETAKKSMLIADKAGNTNYVKMNKESIAEWQTK